MEGMNCNIANDLMPLCVDDVLSEDSKRVLEEHILACPKCKKILEDMKTEVPVIEDKDTTPFKKIRKKLLIRTIIIVFLMLLAAGIYIFCQVLYIPLRYEGDVDDMKVMFMEDGVYVRRENLIARGEVIIVSSTAELSNGIIKFYVAENVPARYRFEWYDRTDYVKLNYDWVDTENIVEVDYCESDGTVLYTLWKAEE